MKNNNQKKIKGNKLWILAVFLFAVSFFAASGQDAAAREITPDSVLGLVNQARLLNGLQMVQKNDLLAKAAMEKMDDMFSNDYFSHTSPKGVAPWYWIEKAGYDYKYAGENLAVDFQTAERQHKAWMESVTHRKNILNPNYQEIGIAVGEGKIDGKETILTVQFFGTKVSAPAVSNNPESGNVQGEEASESSPVENNLQPIEENKIEPITLPKNNPEMTVTEGYGLVDRHQLLHQFSWIMIIFVFAISIFINISIIRNSQSLRTFQPAK